MKKDIHPPPSISASDLIKLINLERFAKENIYYRNRKKKELPLLENVRIGALLEKSVLEKIDRKKNKKNWIMRQTYEEEGQERESLSLYCSPDSVEIIEEEKRLVITEIKVVSSESNKERAII